MSLLFSFVSTAPPPPVNVVATVRHTLNISVLFVVSWDRPERVPVAGFNITTSKTQPILTNKTNLTIEIDYNTRLTYKFTAYNCFGTSEGITKELYVGKSILS